MDLMDLTDVFIYRNVRIHKYSIRSHATKIVVGHSSTVVLLGPKFIVSEAGRQRVLRQKVKNVHAGVRGGLYEENMDISPYTKEKYRVYYNPYKTKGFTNKDGQIIAAAEIAVLTENGVFAYGQRGIEQNREDSKALEE